MTKSQRIFYSNTDRFSISYEVLLNSLTKEGSIYTCRAFDTSQEFFLNFLRAIVRGVDITLVDPLHPAVSSYNKIEVTKLKPLSLEDFRNAILNSEMKITIFTSGTTGQPKKVVHAMENLLREVRIHEKHDKSVWAFAYNPTHMAGLQVLLQAICNFNTLIDVFGKGKKEILNALINKQVSHISATPTFYRFLMPFGEPVNTVKSVSLGGEKSDKQLHNNIRTTFPNARIFNIYASTEAGTIFSSHGSNFEIKNNLFDKVKIENNELFIHNSLTGDYGEGKKDEWYGTGDIIEWINKEKKVFKIISRKNEMINVGGNKVNPHDIEEKILNIKGVKTCFVFGKPNPLLGNIICADVVRENQEVTEILIKKNLREFLENFEIPRKINFVSALETTRTGKLKRS